MGDGEEVVLEKNEVIWRCWLINGEWPLLRRRDIACYVCDDCVN